MRTVQQSAGIYRCGIANVLIRSEMTTVPSVADPADRTVRLTFDLISHAETATRNVTSIWI
jgi:hypothetical protein